MMLIYFTCLARKFLSGFDLTSFSWRRICEPFLKYFFFWSLAVLEISKWILWIHWCFLFFKKILGPWQKIKGLGHQMNNFFNGHGNEPVFSMFLHKSLWPRSLTLPFKQFWFWLRILGDIRIRKSTPHIGESGSDKIAWSIHFFQTFK